MSRYPEFELRSCRKSV